MEVVEGQTASRHEGTGQVQTKPPLEDTLSHEAGGETNNERQGTRLPVGWVAGDITVISSLLLRFQTE